MAKKQPTETESFPSPDRHQLDRIERKLDELVLIANTALTVVNSDLHSIALAFTSLADAAQRVAKKYEDPIIGLTPPVVEQNNTDPLQLGRIG